MVERKPTFLAANKVDDQNHEVGMWEYLSMGLGEPNPVSALHGSGTADLLDLVIATIPELENNSVVEDEVESETWLRSLSSVDPMSVNRRYLTNS
ncbi:MAG: hypothetical protein CM15mP49_07690 [Actinomycetota bacterium]|nr:MAG: hypothetical protein CM15mP49_07690 [Actinomycetota bacterium]